MWLKVTWAIPYGLKGWPQLQVKFSERTRNLLSTRENAALNWNRTCWKDKIRFLWEIYMPPPSCSGLNCTRVSGVQLQYATAHELYYYKGGYIRFLGQSIPRFPNKVCFAWETFYFVKFSPLGKLYWLKSDIKWTTYSQDVIQNLSRSKSNLFL